MKAREPQNHIFTIKQFAHLYAWPTEASIRSIFYKRHENGFEDAFIRMGRRILIDEKVFWECLKNKKEGKNES